MNTSTNPFHGIWIPLVTPFLNGELDRASVERLTRHYQAFPVNGLIVAATTGEGLTLTQDETEALLATVARTVGGRLPVLLGLSGSDTRKMVAMLERRSDGPEAGYLIACPYYSRPSQEGMFLHFKMLSEATDRPILIYNIPYRTGVNLTNETLFRLAALANIVGVKDCCADASQSAELIRDRPRGFSVLTGEDALFRDALQRGADGGILAAAHIETASFGRVRDAILASDHRTAARLWEGLAELSRLLFQEPNPAPIKHMLWRKELIASPELRLPMTAVGDALAARLDALRVG